MAVKARARKKGFVVAIDGPSGAGKSTVSLQLALALGGKLLDTGAMYRSVAYFSLKKNALQEAELEKIARLIRFRAKRNSNHLLVNGKDLGQKLRTEKVSEHASLIATYSGVRKVLTQQQRMLAKKWARRIPVVVEGRDIGSVVFPNVPFKFFVTADPHVRAKRRWEQLKKQGVKIKLSSILKQNNQRDKQDSSRKVAPFRCPPDAVVVDTSKMDISQVVQFLKAHIENFLKLQ